MRKTDPELTVIVGVLVVSAIGLVGYYVLLGFGLAPPPEALALVSTGVGGALGWATRSALTPDPPVTPKPPDPPVTPLTATGPDNLTWTHSGPPLP